MSDVSGFILRITTKQWVNQVFNMAIYYTSIHRKWKSGQTILFVHKTNLGDAIVGYGVIENVYEKDELSDEERHECERGGWKRALEFKYVKQFDSPLPIKETFLRGSKLRGRYFHGLKLNKEQLDSVMTQAES
jgi:hypothetical protein